MIILNRYGKAFDKIKLPFIKKKILSKLGKNSVLRKGIFEKPTDKIPNIGNKTRLSPLNHLYLTLYLGS